MQSRLIKASKGAKMQRADKFFQVAIIDAKNFVGESVLRIAYAHGING